MENLEANAAVGSGENAAGMEQAAAGTGDEGSTPSPPTAELPLPEGASIGSGEAAFNTAAAGTENASVENAPATNSTDRRPPLEGGLSPEVTEGVESPGAEASAVNEGQGADEASGPSEPDRLREHFDSLLAQEQAFRESCPEFSLQAALADDRFVRLTAPNTGLTVEEAWYALHHRELAAAAAEAAAKEAGEKVANAVIANRSRPTEGGGSPERAIPALDPRAMTSADRDAFRRYVDQAIARGEKVYPGREPARFRA